MQELLRLLHEYPPYRKIESELEVGAHCYLEGMWGASAAYLIAALAARGSRKTMLVLLPQIEQAEAFEEDIEFFAPGLALPFPAWERISEDETPDAEIRSQRLAVLKRLAAGGGPAVIVAPVQAVLQGSPSPDALKQNSLTLRKGLELSPDAISQWLASREFQPVRQAEVPGEFSRRGGILDIFPLAARVPVRLEFFGDEIESIRVYDPASQSSQEEIEGLTVSALAPGSQREEIQGTLFDHLPPAALLVLREPAEVMRNANDTATRALSDYSSKAMEELHRAPLRFATLEIASLPGVFSGRPHTFHVHSTERFAQDVEQTVKELENVCAERRRMIVLCANTGERDRLVELLGKSTLLADPHFEVRVGRVNQGFDWTDLSLSLLTHHEMFRRYKERRPAARYRHVRPLDSFYELERGDYVVHAMQGIGRFHGMELMDHGEGKQEVLKIEYADGAFLYAPADRIDLVQKYVGPADRRPPMSKLGTRGWLNRKERAEESVRDLALGLLRLQAIREATPGIAHPADGDWQREFEEAFPYEETEDQLTIARETKRDMERTRPMDRLICGDVGYGKTEIAMRAAFKAVMGGAQVAVLVPTTILAAQHTKTFRERMADYPVRVEMLSRFVSDARQNEIVADLAGGAADIAIGTHRLIQPDILFKNLGLVIIDEEQRFGVEHKERLKRLRETVDVLTLSATPIPRTLHMSLIGLRDISSLNTPPRDRLAIHTRLMRFDPHKVRQAILHEMARGGQVFFLHNRVETIDVMAANLRELVPEARFLIGHGQMPERQLAQVMQDFVEGRSDVLVCTTIIESGLDIPNVNTILINNAEMFGLSELHQLRGRVGRYKHRAYAYMILPAERPVTPIAEKRLKAIEEFSELGAGFRIAMRDLEIRGAGNILGPEQSGHIAAVGYDMYCQLVDHAVRALKNEPAPERPDVSVALGVEAFFPESYIPDASQRIEMYRKLHRASSAEDVQAVLEELRDRFGPIPPPADMLLQETRLRQLAHQAGISDIAVQGKAIILHTNAPARGAAVITAAGETCRRVDDQTLHIPFTRSRVSGAILVSFLTRVFERGLSQIPQKSGVSS